MAQKLVYAVLISVLVVMNFGKVFHAFKLDLNLGLFKIGKSLLDVDFLGRQGNTDLSQATLDPDTYRTLPELITSKGYPVEEHDVITKDGYVLGVKRIPRGINDQDDAKVRPPVLLHHGLLSSGCDWVMNGPHPNQSLGFLLADAGYDVWIANARGNTYSKKHTKYTSYDANFWQFSWDEMALIDLPTVIDHILAATGQEQVFHVGHSMGTTVAFAMLSEYPEYNKKVKAVMALAPVATLGHITSPIRYLVPFANDLGFILAMLGQNEFLPSSTLLHIFSDLMCSQQPSRDLCNNIVYQIGGGNSRQLNESRYSVISHHSPAGTSTMTVLHYAQLIASREFTKYDYGKKENMRVYGQNHPPKFNIEDITTPIALFWSDNDSLADPTDVALLAPRIKNLIENYEIPLPEFTHIDFVYGIDANKLVYQKIISVLDTFKE